MEGNPGYRGSSYPPGCCLLDDEGAEKSADEGVGESVGIADHREGSQEMIFWLDWCGNHPVLFLFILGCIYWGFVRTLRAITVSIHGWPPPHLDADGDFRRSDEDA